MKIDLCKLFGVEEGEEFKIEGVEGEELTYRIKNNRIEYKDTICNKFRYSYFGLNEVNKIKNIIKLPKKEFTDDELCILRNIDKESKWIARDESNNLYVYKNKPIKFSRYWDVEYGERQRLKVFSHLFQQIQWEDEEPVFIDDYVERGADCEN